MKKKERLVFFYDLELTASSKTSKTPKTPSIEKAFELMDNVPIEDRVLPLPKSNQHVYISDWKKEGNLICILINKSDQSIADPVFTVPQTRSRRIINKRHAEGQDSSIHVLIQLPDNSKDPALTLIERCNGFGYSIIELLFNEILLRAKQYSPNDFQQSHLDGSIDESGKKKVCDIELRCSFQGHISSEFRDDLERGTIQSIELLTERNEITEFDEDSYVVTNKSSIGIKVEGNNPKSRVAAVFAFCKEKKSDYSKARIKFRTCTGIARTVTFETDTDTTNIDVYVRREKIDKFESDLQSSYEKVHKPIYNKMKELLT